MTEQHLIAIAGDQTIDWFWKHEPEIEARHTDERLRKSVHLYWMPGGVWLLESMIEKAVHGIHDFHTRTARNPDPETGNVRTYDNPFNHSFAMLSDYDGKTGRERVRSRSKEDHSRGGDDGTDSVIRVREYLGFIDRNQVASWTDPNQFRLRAKPSDPDPAIIVVDDADLGFRDNPEHWKDLIPGPKALEGKPLPWVVLKISHNLHSGDFWNREIRPRLVEAEKEHDWLPDRLIVMTTAVRLRDAGANISKDLSWERTARDAVLELFQPHKNSTIQSLGIARRLIVSFGPTGTLLVEHNGGRDLDSESVKCTLVFDQESTDGTWTSSGTNGMMFGYGSGVCAAIIRQLAWADKGEPDLIEGLKDGLQAIRGMHRRGFHLKQRTHGQLECPIEFFDRPHDFQTATQTLKDYEAEDISFLASLHKGSGNPEELRENLLNAARRIVRHGVENGGLEGVPVGKFGNLLLVDRDEIEVMRAIGNQTRRYRRVAGLDTKPLSIAVFGAPGAGKSTAVRELIPETEDGQRRVEELDFNLSQYNSPEDLVGAFHQIRDVALKGCIPIAFWDEFDTDLNGRRLGWIRYFLAPMQDGAFRQGETEHRVGPAIFAFAGGVYPALEDFRTAAKSKKAASSKALDFLSRLQGYMNILGLNPVSNEDRSVTLRRAIVLRAILLKHNIAPAMVDERLVSAFLEAREYKHGVRSIDTIIRMSSVDEGEPFRPDSLPSSRQLALHVDERDFLKHMDRDACSRPSD